MNNGFIKICAAAPEIRVADCAFNAESIISCIMAANDRGAKIIVLPELTITGCTAGDLFFQKGLLSAAQAALFKILKATRETDMIICLGTVVEKNSQLYSCAVILYRGNVLAAVPKKHITALEARYFACAPKVSSEAVVCGRCVPFGTDILISDRNLPALTLAAEVGSDSFAPVTPSSYHALSGATVILNPAAFSEAVGADEYITVNYRALSRRLSAAVVTASAGSGESTTDMVFSARHIITECGRILEKGEAFSDALICTDIDIERIAYERRCMSPGGDACGYTTVYTDLDIEETKLLRHISPTPFIPEDKAEADKVYLEILTTQSMALKKRLLHTHSKSAVIGISGGLDSTLALLCTARAFEAAGLDKSGIIAVTMPCFGTTGRTYNNAVTLTNACGAVLLEVDIKKSVLQHFEDIGHTADCFDVTYENSQARERTQVLMDIANKNGALVIGTGDMSELALGWATYNGDHMSMYGVNAGIPKTLIRCLVQYEADNTDNSELKKTLLDILDTPVSPELLPPEDGEIAQKTEQVVGPYLLHDFFLFYTVRYGFSPSKILRLAIAAFDGEFDRKTILYWEKTFYRRFFSQQFKRSCLPDGPSVGSVSLSPRGGWCMPSDAMWSAWQSELELL